MAMREQSGRPGPGIMPAVQLPGEAAPLGHVITVLNRAPAHTVRSEFAHMAGATNDPAVRRSRAIQFLSAAYYQNAEQFCDTLTATFAPGSQGAAKIRDAGTVTLIFDAFAQRFDLSCKVWRLAPHNPLFEATMAHNRLFNPGIPAGTEVLGFEPDWPQSRAEPDYT